MKKKILMVCEAFGGGVFAYVSQLCNDMSDIYDVYLAYSLRPQTPKNFEKSLNTNVHLIELEYLGKKGVTDISNNLKSIKEIRKIYSEVSPDIIHLHSSIAGAIGRIAFKNMNNVIYTPHGYAHILLGNNLKSKLYYFAEKILGKKNSIILTCCESEDQESKKFSRRTYYIETGINIHQFQKSVSELSKDLNSEFTVFTLGRICEQKQPTLFNQIAEKLPEISFLWIGDGELRDVLTSKNITVTGWKSRMEALNIAKKSDVFILPSLGEAIAMSLLENMFLEKLVIVSDTIGNKSVIENGINGFKCCNIKQYVEAIKSAREEFPTDIVRNAKNDVLNIYNSDVMKKKFIDFYDSL